MLLPRRLTPWLMVALVAGLLAAPAGATTDEVGADTPQRALVRVADDADPHDLAAEASTRGAEVRGVFTAATTAFAATLTDDVAAWLADDPRVLAVEADREVEAFVPTGVQRIGADEHEPTGIGQGTAVDADIAILDTGVDARHPELDVVAGVDCRDGTCRAVNSPRDPHGHGTHVAGTAAATDGGEVVGVAAGARLHSVRVLDSDGSGSLSAVVAGLDWVAERGGDIEVANVSLGCDCRSSTLDAAVDGVVGAGVTVVAAAGNEGVDAGTFAPANHPATLTVGAMSDYDGTPGGAAATGCIPDPDDSFASYSNHGAVVDLVAPGSCIRSTVPGGYALSSGTSMAAPHAAGAAAVYIATQGLTASPQRPETVREALADEFSVASTDDCGYTGDGSSAPMLHFTCVDLSGNAEPTLTVTSPGDDLEVVTGDVVELRGSADDDEDGDLDGAIEWHSSLDGHLGTGGTVDAALAAVGVHSVVASVTDSSGAMVRETRRVRVTDTEGETAEDVEEEPSVPEEPEPEQPPASDTPPEVVILAPVPDGRLVAGRDAKLVSWARDAEDGDVRSRVRWRSDRDGDLGRGGTIAVRLSAGWHRITAEVTDRDGNTAARTSRIQAAEPTDLTSRGLDAACPPDRTPDGGFRDVDGGPHEHAIDCVAWWDVTQGTGSDTYSPRSPVTRAQMATFLARMIRESGGSLPSAGGSQFDDVGTSGTHADNINRLAAAGVVQGRTATTFAPNGIVTRAQMATFLVRTYEYRTGRTLPGIQSRFADDAGVHQARVDAVAAAGVTGGVTPTRYEPNADVRRDQMASFIARSLDVLVTTGTTAPPR